MYKILRIPDVDTNKSPTLPLLIIFYDGSVFESDSIESIISILIKDDYSKLDSKNKYIKKIEVARKEAMYALQDNLNVLVTDGKKIIKNNYAADPNDSDYKYSENELKNAKYIRIDDDKKFIESLVKIKSFRILERADSNIFSKNKNSSKILKKEYIDICLSFDNENN
jgi:hypothetical protein